MNYKADINPEYDFDVVSEYGFLRYWVLSYMEGTKRAIAKSGASLAGTTLYDIGFGRGRGLTLFKTLGVKKVIGIDISSAVISFAQKQKERLNFDLEVIIDDEQNSYLRSIPSDSCDAVTLMNILYAFGEESRKRVLQEAKRIVRHGGFVIIADACKPSLMWLFNNLSSLGRIFSTEEELKRTLHPLELKASEPSNHFYFINRAADMLGRIFGPQIFVVLDKAARVFRIPASTKSFVFKKV